MDKEGIEPYHNTASQITVVTQKITRLTRPNLDKNNYYEIYSVNKRDGAVEYKIQGSDKILICQPNEEFEGTRLYLGQYTDTFATFAPMYNGLMHCFDKVEPHRIN